jgi:hypothetical protein
MPLHRLPAVGDKYVVHQRLKRDEIGAARGFRH